MLRHYLTMGCVLCVYVTNTPANPLPLPATLQWENLYSRSNSEAMLSAMAHLIAECRIRETEEVKFFFFSFL